MNNSNVEYASGQVWRYKTRPGEEASRLYIVQIDELSNGNQIYHILLNKVAIGASGFSMVEFHETVPHIPVSNDTLEISVTELEQENAVIPDIAQSIEKWQRDFENGEDGVYIESISAILDVIQRLEAPPSFSGVFMSMEQEDRLQLSLNQARRITGISKETLRQAITKGQLIYEKDAFGCLRIEVMELRRRFF